MLNCISKYEIFIRFKIQVQSKVWIHSYNIQMIKLDARLMEQVSTYCKMIKHYLKKVTIVDLVVKLQAINSISKTVRHSKNKLITIV